MKVDIKKLIKPFFTPASITVIATTTALTSMMYLGQTDRPFDLVGIRFCPKTANINKTNYWESQERLDRKYCQYEHKILKEIWESKQFDAKLPLPENSFKLRDIPSTDAGGKFLYMLTPVVMGVALIAWSKHTNNLEETSHKLLENYKTKVKTEGVSAREERDFKGQTISRTWDNKRVETKLMSKEALQDQLQKQTEIHDLTHDAAKLQLGLAMSEMSKGIAENNRDTAKAEKERSKLTQLDCVKDTPASEEVILELSDEHKWYREVLNESFKVITGISGSGKSTMENVFIQLARQDNQYIVVLYPNTTRTARDSNAIVLSDVESINDYLNGFNDLVNSRKADAKKRGIDEDDYLDYLSDIKGETGCIAIYCMEGNNWESQGINPDLLAAFLRLSMIDVRKWGITVTLTGQSFNQGSFCSKLTNFADLLKKQTVIECVPTTNEKGRTIGSNKAWLKRPIDKEPVEVPTLHYKPTCKSKY